VVLNIKVYVLEASFILYKYYNDHHQGLDLSVKAPCHEDILREWRYSSMHSLTLALDGGEWSASHPGRFTPRERDLGTH
jgi:hypothetical protein